ncbi:hypothetical protein LCGC14_1792680 [marine sediment metagenome]|uniref:Transglutaminase-like domain-containing protein n=1 Tax=marine sediment metagenome TaxID=412755 RepID=A0A0F9GS36_9ZZZZ
MYAVRTWIPASDRGVEITVEVLRRLALAGGPLVELTAEYLQERAQVTGISFASLLRGWLSRYTRHELDPFNVELLREPEYALNVILEDGVLMGDCDDVAVLAAALAHAAGVPSRFVLLAWGGPWSHILTEVWDAGSGWIDMDVQRAVLRRVTCVDSGAGGLGFADGDDHRVEDSLVVLRPQPWVNVGIYVWDFRDTRPDDEPITVTWQDGSLFSGMVVTSEPDGFGMAVLKLKAK